MLLNTDLPFTKNVYLGDRLLAPSNAAIREAVICSDMDIFAVLAQNRVRTYKISEGYELVTVEIPSMITPTYDKKPAMFRIGQDKLAVFNSYGEVLVIDIATGIIVFKTSIIVDHEADSGVYINNNVFYSSTLPGTVIFFNQGNKNVPRNRQLIYFDTKGLRVKRVIDIDYPELHRSWSPWLPRLLKDRYLLLRIDGYNDVIVCDCLSGEIVGKMPFGRHTSAVNYDPEFDNLYVAYDHCLLKFTGNKSGDPLKYDFARSISLWFGDYQITKIINYQSRSVVLCEASIPDTAYYCLCRVDTDKGELLNKDPNECVGYNSGRIVNNIYRDNVTELCVVVECNKPPREGIKSVAKIFNLAAFELYNETIFGQQTGQ
jgi:hypothetical protein